MSSEYKCSTHPCLIGVTPQMSVKPNPTNDRILAMTSEEIELLKQTSTLATELYLLSNNANIIPS